MFLLSLLDLARGIHACIHTTCKGLHKTEMLGLRDLQCFRNTQRWLQVKMNKSYIIIMNEEEQQKKSFNKFHEIHLLSGHDLFLFSPILRNGLIESNHIHAGRSEVSRAMLYEMGI